MHVSDKITLGNKGRRIILQDLARAQCAYNPVEKAAYKAAAYNKLELLASLELLTIKQYNDLKSAIEKVKFEQIQQREQSNYSSEKKHSIIYHDKNKECCLGGKWYKASELAQEIRKGNVLVIDNIE